MVRRKQRGKLSKAKDSIYHTWLNLLDVPSCPIYTLTMSSVGPQHRHKRSLLFMSTRNMRRYFGLELAVRTTKLQQSYIHRYEVHLSILVVANSEHVNSLPSVIVHPQHWYFHWWLTPVSVGGLYVWAYVQGELAVSYKWLNWLSLRNNRLRFEASSELPINLEESKNGTSN
jgi:hypothetical protein